ncbi:MAG: hypothetical protein QY326_07265 [Bdellovibrionota bacterium]|nr:MAG: hypothetical protein QY326_07265 [Bdellovibrionota bacterium]
MRDNLIAALQLYSHGLYSLVVAALDSATPESGVGAVRVDGRWYVPFRRFISDKSFWDGKYATVVPSILAVPNSVSSIPEQARPYAHSLRSGLVTIEWAAAEDHNLASANDSRLSNGNHLLHDRDGTATIEVPFADLGVHKGAVHLAATTWGKLEFKMSVEESIADTGRVSGHRSFRETVSINEGDRRIAIYSRQMDTKDLPTVPSAEMRAGLSATLEYPWSVAGMALTPQVIADAWRGDYLYLKRFYEDEFRSAAQQYQKHIDQQRTEQKDIEKLIEQATKRFKKENPKITDRELAAKLKPLHARFAACERIIARHEATIAQNRSLYEQRVKIADALPSLQELYASRAQLNWDEQGLAEINRRNAEYAKAQERKLTARLFVDLAAGDPEFSHRADRLKPSSQSVAKAIEDIAIADFAVDTLVRARFPGATLARDITLPFHGGVQTRFFSPDGQPNPLQHVLDGLVAHLESMEGSVRVAQQSAADGPQDIALKRSLAQAQATLEFVERAEQVRAGFLRESSVK